VKSNPLDGYYSTPEGRKAIFSGFDNQTYEPDQVLSDLKLA